MAKLLFAFFSLFFFLVLLLLFAGVWTQIVNEVYAFYSYCNSLPEPINLRCWRSTKSSSSLIIAAADYGRNGVQRYVETHIFRGIPMAFCFGRRKKN